jgi:ubiquinone/menaquinone biosynthesis C-methylase UbiE
MPDRTTAGRGDLTRVWQAYDDMASVYADTWCTPHVLESELPYLQRLVRTAAPSTDRMLLDVGSGPAVYFPHARELELDYVGIDLSIGMLRAGRDRYPTCRVIRADARRIPFADRSIGHVVAMNSLSHMDRRDLEVSLRECGRVTASGGSFLLSDQLGTGVTQMPYPLMRSRVIPVFAHGQRTYESILSAAGFDVLHVAIRAPLEGEIEHEKIMFWSIRRERHSC